MTLHDVHMESGETGRFGEIFVVLGGLFALVGIVLVVLGATGYFPSWNAGRAVDSDSILVGALYVTMGLGFATFGAMAMMSGWGRHHPGYDHE